MVFPMNTMAGVARPEKSVATFFLRDTIFSLKPLVLQYEPPISLCGERKITSVFMYIHLYIFLMYSSMFCVFWLLPFHLYIPHIYIICIYIYIYTYLFVSIHDQDDDLYLRLKSGWPKVRMFMLHAMRVGWSPGSAARAPICSQQKSGKHRQMLPMSTDSVGLESSERAILVYHHGGSEIQVPLRVIHGKFCTVLRLKICWNCGPREGS